MPKIIWLRLIVYYYQENYQQALASIQEAFKLEPENAEAFNLTGLSYTGLKSFEQAITELDQAISFDPLFWIYYHNRGVAYHRLKQNDKALLDFDRAIQLQPQYKLALLYRTAALFKLKKYTQTVIACNQVVKLNYSDKNIFVIRGNAYHWLRLYKLAAADYQQAHILDLVTSLAKVDRILARIAGRPLKIILRDYGWVLIYLPISIGIPVFAGVVRQSPIEWGLISTLLVFWVICLVILVASRWFYSRRALAAIRRAAE